MATRLRKAHFPGSKLQLFGSVPHILHLGAWVWFTDLSPYPATPFPQSSPAPSLSQPPLGTERLTCPSCLPHSSSLHWLIASKSVIPPSLMENVSASNRLIGHLWSALNQRITGHAGPTQPVPLEPGEGIQPESGFKGAQGVAGVLLTITLRKACQPLLPVRKHILHPFQIIKMWAC